jgi:hypothetical protein
MAAAACGGSTFSSSSGDGGAPGGDDAGSSGDAGRDSGLVAACPANTPADRSACPRDGLWCEYGDPSRDLHCNVLAQCGGGRWSVQEGEPDDPVCVEGKPPLDPRCPSSFGGAPSSACGTSAYTCAYDEGRCGCVTPDGPAMLGDGGPPATMWYCEAQTAGCPHPRPRVGSPCGAPANTYCDYGMCVFVDGFELTCADGAWAVAPAGCAASAGR